MLNMKTTIRGGKELAKKWRAVAAKAKKQERRSMQKTLIILQNSVKRNLAGGHPLNVRSGRLRRAIGREIIERGSHIKGTVGSNVIYDPVHEYGAIIRAKTSAGMRFVIDGQWITAHEVTIPKREHYAPAFTSNRERINQLFGRDTNALLQREGLV